MTRPAVWLSLLSACQGLPPLSGEVSSETMMSEHTTDQDGEPYTYEILVRTPPGYDGSTGYPTLYQLDALFNDEFDVAARLVSGLAADGDIDERIVIGVGHPPGGPTAQRDLDFIPPGMTSTPGNEGHADRFFTFLHQQLIPWVDENWATTGAERRALSGHSNGGIFTFYALTHDGPFDEYIAADWGYDAQALTFEEEMAARTTERHAAILFTRATFNGAGQKIMFEELTGRLIDRGYDGLRVEALEIDTDHGGAIATSIEAGLRFLAEVTP